MIWLHVCLLHIEMMPNGVCTSLYRRDARCTWYANRDQRIYLRLDDPRNHRTFDEAWSYLYLQ
jgi:hypothetical protein